MKMEKVFVLCVMCMHTRPGGYLHLLLDVQGHGSSCDDGTCLIALYRSVLLCEVLCLSCGSFFLCAVMFWHLLTSSLVGEWSLINHWHQCVFGFISLIRYHLGCLLYTVWYFIGDC